MPEREIRRRLVTSFVLICIGCVCLHLFLIHKKAVRTQRYEAAYGPQQQPADRGQAEGVVSSVGPDRFHLQVGSKRLTFVVGEGVQKPAVGSLLRVRYNSEGPQLKATDIEFLKP
ncbi:hypothetical protein DYH09_17590 [bacterium CPR1]|nr:hypothetical protein [bacterium CPR1]